MKPEGVERRIVMKARRLARLGVLCALAALCVGSVSAGEGGESRFASGALTVAQARSLDVRTTPAGRAPARAASTWCGAPTGQDLTPNALAGYPVHWLYAIPADGSDGLSTYASAMQTDAEAIEAWWRAQDPSRAPRNDLAPFACGQQLDLTQIRLRASSVQLSSVEVRFDTIADELIGLGLGSKYDKYVVYYDGPVELEICGQGGSDSSGLGYAIVYVRACPGVPASTTAAHELLHTMGAVSAGAPNMCPEPLDGHVCDDPYDMMFPFGDETPITGLALDTGRDDYYGHPGSWPDVQDSPWLTQLDRQAPLSLAVSGPGRVVSDLPGLDCSAPCTTTWNAGTQLALSAVPGPGAKLVRWGGACTGSGSCQLSAAQGMTASALFAPAQARLTVAVTGKGVVRAAGGIACPSRCSTLRPSYVPLTLTAKAMKGWRLKTWSGACRGSRPTCSVPMTAETRARAIFVRA
jgi:hypothetical protein